MELKYSRNIERGIYVALLLVFGLVLLRTAWICDDAYISLRTVDNFVSGFGLRWNIADRVQTFTHPLWVLLLSLLYFFTRELFLTTILCSITLSAAAVALATSKLAKSRPAGIIGLLVLLLSPSFIDYCSSGLENPLSFLVLVLFLIVYWREDDARQRPFLLGLLAALALVTRLDHLWLYFPPLLLELHRRRGKRAAGMMLLGFAPLLLWAGFALTYYGFLLPNAAFAKLRTGIGQGAYIGQGIIYFGNLIRHDPLTALALAWGLVMGLASGRGRERALGLGLLLHLLYLLAVGGDFMRGRFFSLPLLLSVALIMRQDLFAKGRLRLLSVPVVLLFGFLAPKPTILSGSDFGGRVDHEGIKRSHGITDERGCYFHLYGLFNGLPLATKLGHDMAGLHETQSHLRSRIMEVSMAGENGFVAGPDVFVVDSFALGDALLARLEMGIEPYWRIAHFPRNVPAGYLLSALTGADRIRDPRIREYYAKLRLITRGPIFDRRRWIEIAKMNLGRYEHLVKGNRDYRAEGREDYVVLAEEVPNLGNERIMWEACEYYLARREYENAEPILGRLLEIRPHYTQNVIELAVERAKAGDHAVIEELLAFLMRADPECADAKYYLGGLYCHTGREEEGIALLKEALRLGHPRASEFLAELELGEEN